MKAEGIENTSIHKLKMKGRVKMDYAKMFEEKAKKLPNRRLNENILCRS